VFQHPKQRIGRLPFSSYQNLALFKREENNFTDAKRGPVVSQTGKTRITIYIDADILEEFRARSDKAGYGYQTMINDALKEYLSKKEKPLDETVLRQVIREELDRVAHH
jgi:uncharacterized protein (DUF4415 family)